MRTSAASAVSIMSVKFSTPCESDGERGASENRSSKKFLFAGFPAKEIYPPAVQNKRRGSLEEPPLSDSPLGVQRQQVALEIKIVVQKRLTTLECATKELCFRGRSLSSPT